MLRTLSIATFVANLVACAFIPTAGLFITKFAASFTSIPIPTQMVLYACLVVQGAAVIVGLQVALVYAAVRKRKPTAQPSTPGTRPVCWWCGYLPGTLLLLVVSAAVHWFFLSKGQYHFFPSHKMHANLIIIQPAITIGAMFVSILMALVSALWRKKRGMAVVLCAILIATLAAIAGLHVLLYVDSSGRVEPKVEKEEGFDQSMLLPPNNGATGEDKDYYGEEGYEEDEYEEEYDNITSFYGEDEQYAEGEPAPAALENPKYTAIAHGLLDAEQEQGRRIAIKSFIEMAEWVAYSTHNKESTAFEAINRALPYSMYNDELDQADVKDPNTYAITSIPPLMVDFFKRYPQAIMPAWEQSKGMVLTLLPKATYDTSHYSLLTNLLLESHHYIYRANEDYTTRLDHMYQAMLRVSRKYEDRLLVYEQYPYLRQYMDEDAEYAQQVRTTCREYELDYQTVMVWAYSFWARRHHEGSDDVAYQLLSSVTAMYSR